MKDSINEEEIKQIRLNVINEKLCDPAISVIEKQHYLSVKEELLQNKNESTQKNKQRNFGISSLFNYGWNRKKLFAGIFCLMMLSGMFAFVVGTNMAYSVAYKEGALVGYTTALTDTANLLQQQGITLDWNRQADGAYKLVVHTPNGQSSQVTVAANLIVEIRDGNGKLKETARGAGTFTNLGKNWTISQLSNVANAIASKTAPNATQFAAYLSESTSSAGIGTSSVILPSEITTNGLERVIGSSSTYISVGSWNVTKVKTVTTGDISPLIWGLNYDTYASTPNSLIAYDATPGTKNLAVGDTETETWTITIT